MLSRTYWRSVPIRMLATGGVLSQLRSHVGAFLVFEDKAIKHVNIFAKVWCSRNAIDILHYEFDGEVLYY